ncbi:MAG: hypothetical protein ACTTKT_03715 [Prevotella veroralis]
MSREALFNVRKRPLQIKGTLSWFANATTSFFYQPLSAFFFIDH